MASRLSRRGVCAAAVGFVLASMPLAAQARSAGLTSESVATMGAGSYLWDDASGAVSSPSGVRLLVSIPDQKLYVYRGSTLLAVSAVSTGKPGHDTPTGDFKILQKAVKHSSNLYNAAAMPYMQRITWDGVAIHAGRDPGYAASHGCVRVPIAFAKRLYAITQLGARVTITDESLTDQVVAAPVTKPAPVETPVQETEVVAAPVETSS
ncbi:L,D-transpeptidase family protein [Sphingomonas sp. UYP23]